MIRFYLLIAAGFFGLISLGVALYAIAFDLPDDGLTLKLYLASSFSSIACLVSSGMIEIYRLGVDG